MFSFENHLLLRSLKPLSGRWFRAEANCSEGLRGKSVSNARCEHNGTHIGRLNANRCMSLKSSAVSFETAGMEQMCFGALFHQRQLPG